MELNHETIQSYDFLPFNVFTFYAKDNRRIITQHWHESTELLDCLFGELDVWIEGKHYLMHKNDLIIINPGVIHFTKSPVPNHVLCVQLPLSFLQKITENLFGKKILFDLNTVQKQNSETKILSNKLLELTKIIESSSNKSIISRINEQALILECISELIKHQTKTIAAKDRKTKGSDIKFMNDVTEYMKKYSTKDISLHKISKHFRYSDAYFSRSFKKQFHMSYQDFLASIRLNDALVQMMTTDLSLDTIAENCGFKTYRNFYNTFYQIYQTNPNSLRYKTSFNGNSAKLIL